MAASEMGNKDVTETAEDEACMMEVFEKNLNDLEDNSNNLLESLEQLNLRSDSYLDELASEISKLQENVESTLAPFWQRIKNEMFDAKCYIKEKEEALRKLETELVNRENVLINLRHEFEDAKTTLFNQSSYTASLGATLCTLLWSACGNKLIAVDLLKQKKLVDLLEMIPDSLRSFFESFGENLPSVQSKEYQFILSMIGIITNITAVSEGRKFLTNSQEGERIIQELLGTVFNIPDSDIHMQRTILMVLYNMSLDKRGIRIIENDALILPFLVQHIQQPDGKLRYVSLRLFQSLAYHVKNVKFLETLYKTTSSKANNSCLNKLEKELSPLLPYEAYFDYEPLIQLSPRDLIAAEDLPVTSSRSLAMSSPARNWPEESPSSPDPEVRPMARPVATSTPAMATRQMYSQIRSFVRPPVNRPVHVAPRQLLFPPRPSSIGIGRKVAIPGQRRVEPVGAPPNANAPPAVATSADSSMSAADIRRARIIRRNSGRARRCYACRRPGHKAEFCNVFPAASGSNNQRGTEPRTGREQQKCESLCSSFLKNLEQRFDKLEERVAKNTRRMKKYLHR